MKGFTRTDDVIDRVELSVALLTVGAVLVAVVASALGWGIPFLCRKLPLEGAQVICSPTPASSQFLPGLITATLDLTTSRSVDTAPRPVATVTAEPRQTPVAITGALPSFDALAFCEDLDLDKQAQRCSRSQIVFRGCVQTVYVSWSHSNVYTGMSFTRKWFRDDEATPIPGHDFRDIWDGIRWSTDAPSEYTWLNASSLYTACLPPGPYRVELYIESELEQSGSFTVES